MLLGTMKKEKQGESTVVHLDAVRSADLFGRYNALFYSHPDAFKAEARPSSALVGSSAVNEWIFKSLLGQRSDSPKVFVELASSGHYKRRIDFSSFCRDVKQQVSLIETNHCDAEYTDHDLSFDPLSISVKKIDLLDSATFTNAIGASQKADGAFMTYGTDSVWSKNDLIITKSNNEYFVETYQAHFDGDSNSTLAQGLAGEPSFSTETLNSIPIEDFERVTFSTQLHPFAIDDHLYADLIKERLEGHEKASVVFPATLVDTVERCFEHLLHGKGKVVIADVAKFESPVEHKPISVDRTGFAFFKYDDWWLAKKILEKKKYSVRISKIQDTLVGGSPAEWYLLSHMNAHYFMEVTLPDTSHA